MKNGSGTGGGSESEIGGCGSVVDDGREKVGRSTRRSRSGVERDDGGEVGGFLGFGWEKRKRRSRLSSFRRARFRVETTHKQAFPP